MKGMQKVASLVTGLGTMALLASPGSAAMAPANPVMQPSIMGVDPVIMRAATAVAQPMAPGIKVQSSGTDVVRLEKCIVKFFEPEELKTRRNSEKHDPWQKHRKDDEPTFFFQTKLICTDVVGISEILIEQNDQLVVAGTITNNQTDITLHNLTVRLNQEQGEQFCLAVARQTAVVGAFAVVAQQCFFNLGDEGHDFWSPKGGGGYSKGE
ncbi:MAG: hypothetical protein NTZ05_14115 [Chloroflexi bacterium]|nr:hypothetical protein [Chloroflexota bacterium]